MTDGWVFLGLNAAICLGGFLVGLRFSRMEANPWTGKSLFGMKVEGGDMPIAQINRFGKLLMICSVLFLFLVSALCFGLLGQVDGIRTIGQ